MDIEELIKRLQKKEIKISKNDDGEIIIFTNLKINSSGNIVSLNEMDNVISFAKYKAKKGRK
jgi:hypothetical protein